MSALNKIDKYYVWGIKGIIFLIPFIPLYVTPSLAFPYIAGKNFAFRVLVEFAAALWLGLMSTGKEYRLRSSPLILSILIFTFIVGLADLFGVSPYNSFWSNYERMEGYITILHLTLFFMICSSVFKSKKDWIILFNIFVLVSMLVSSYALVASLQDTKSPQFAMIYGQRIYGTIGNPTFLAAYLMLSIFIAFILIFNTQRRSLKFLYISLISINTIAIYYSSSRGSILAAIIGVGIISLINIFEKINPSGKKLIRNAVLSLVSIFIVLSVLFLSFRNAEIIRQDRTLSRFATIFSDDSAQNRVNTWKLAWEGIKERPILGWGQENFRGIYTVNPIPLVDEQLWFDRAHNIVIDWLVNAGGLGLFSYLAIFGAAFYALRIAFQKKTIPKNVALTILTALTVYFIQNLFTFDTINTYLSFFTLLAYVDSLDYPESGADLNSEKNIPPKVMLKSACTGLIALLLFSGMSYFINYRPIKESKLFMRIRAGHSGSDSFTLLLDDFNRALSLQTFGDPFVRQGMRDISSYIIKKEFFMMDGALKFIEATVEELEKGVSAAPYDLENLATTIITYMEFAKYEPSFHARTETLIKTCIQLNPEYEWPYMVLTDLYILKKDYKLAYDNLKKMVESDPLNDTKQFKLALAAILVSKDDVVSRALENISKIRRGTNASDYNGKSYLSFSELYQLAQTYREAMNYQKALQYYDEIIRSGDLNQRLKKEAKIRIEIASVYFAVGDKENALRETKKAVELDPGILPAELINSLNN